MEHTAESHIASVKEAREFMKHLVNDLHLSFHPDDDFNDYKDERTKERLFNDEEAQIYNALMAEAFRACENADADIYDLGWEVIEKGINDGLI